MSKIFESLLEVYPVHGWLSADPRYCTRSHANSYLLNTTALGKPNGITNRQNEKYGLTMMSKRKNFEGKVTKYPFKNSFFFLWVPRFIVSFYSADHVCSGRPDNKTRKIISRSNKKKKRHVAIIVKMQFFFLFGCVTFAFSTLFWYFIFSLFLL